MIKFQNVKKSFGNKVILDKVSGEFKKGHVNLIVGASGTGKSVLMKCIVGLLTPEEGEIYFDGRQINDSDTKLITEIRREIGMLFQGGALFDSLNILENVMFPLEVLTKTPISQQVKRANQCLEKVGLKNIGKKMISEISGGMKKRVGIARAIVNNPKYLFCDEPNSGLDPQTALQVDELIRDITHEYKMTTIVVTHDINSMITIGEHILFFYKGHKTWEGDADGIFNADDPKFRDFFFSNEMAKMIKK